MAYGDSKDLPRRTLSDKALGERTSDIAKSQKYDGYQHGLASIVYDFFKKSLLLRVQINLPLTKKLELLLKPAITRTITQTNY